MHKNKSFSELLKTPHQIVQGTYGLRPMSEKDRSCVKDLFDHLSSKSRYYRYYQYLNDLPEDLLNKIVQANRKDDFAIGAFLQHDNSEEKTLIGIVRYVEESIPGEAEFSISVRDDFQHEGVGSHLMEIIFRAAQENGYKKLHGYVMSDNHEMLTLMSNLGAECTRDPDDMTMMITTFTVK